MACWLTVGLVLAGGWLLYAWLTRKYDYFAKRGVAFVKPTPLFGVMLGPMRRAESFGDMFKKIYWHLKPHKVGGFFEFTTPLMMATDPEVIRLITVKHFDHFADRRVLTKESTDPLSHRSLPSLTGAHWRHMRNRLSPAFTTSKLRGMFPLIARCGEQFARFLVTRPRGEPLEFKAAFTRLTNDVIATVAFGIECNAVKDPKEKFYKYGQELTKVTGLKILLMFGYMIVPKVMEFFKLSFMSKEITNYFRQLTKGTMEYREKNKLSRPDMLQLLMAAQKGGIERAHGDEQDAGTVGEDEHAAALHQQHLAPEQQDNIQITDDDVAAQAFIFFFAGFETVATLLSFMAHELAVNPDVQQRLREEIDATILENDGKLTYDSVQNMKYLDMVVSETLRAYPPAGLTDRMCTKTFLVAGTNVVIEKGTTVLLPMNALQHDPEYFPNPDKFDPERFSEENKKNIKPYTYLPFGSGPHNCIGMRLALLEVKVVAAHLLAACELRVGAKTQVPLKLSKTSMIMNAEDGFWLDVVPRERPAINL